MLKLLILAMINMFLIFPSEAKNLEKNPINLIDVTFVMKCGSQQDLGLLLKSKGMEPIVRGHVFEGSNLSDQTSLSNQNEMMVWVTNDGDWVITNKYPEIELVCLTQIGKQFELNMPTMNSESPQPKSKERQIGYKH